MSFLLTYARVNKIQEYLGAIMTDNDLKYRFEYIKKIAHDAGQMALTYFNMHHELSIEQKKNPHDLVSEADRKVEELICHHIRQKFPEDNIYGEEHGLQKAHGDVTWLIDPIDGTYAFLHGIPLWCVSISAIYKGEPFFGIIVDPNHHEIFTAFKGKGAFCNEKPIYAMKDAHLQSASIAFGIDRGWRADIAQKFFNQSIEKKIHLARTYTCALNMAWVASGRMLGVFYPYVSSWDFCAGLILIDEAGGKHNDPLKNIELHEGNALLATATDVYEELSNLSQIRYLMSKL